MMPMLLLGPIGVCPSEWQTTENRPSTQSHVSGMVTLPPAFSILSRADALISSLPAGKREFFNDYLRTQARFMLGLNQALREVARAMERLPDKGHAAASLQAAETIQHNYGDVP